MKCYFFVNSHHQKLYTPRTVIQPEQTNDKLKIPCGICHIDVILICHLKSLTFSHSTLNERVLVISYWSFTISQDYKYVGAQSLWVKFEQPNRLLMLIILFILCTTNRYKCNKDKTYASKEEKWKFDACISHTIVSYLTLFVLFDFNF